MLEFWYFWPLEILSRLRPHHGNFGETSIIHNGFQVKKEIDFYYWLLIHKITYSDTGSYWEWNINLVNYSGLLYPFSKLPSLYSYAYQTLTFYWSMKIPLTHLSIITVLIITTFICKQCAIAIVYCIPISAKDTNF